MKNKAGTAAGNPRARADRASPTMNGNPNAQVCPVCFDVHVHCGHRHICIHLTLLLSFTPYTIPHPASHVDFFSLIVAPAVCFSALFGFARWCWCQLPGLSAKFWVLALRPGPWPCPGATAVAGLPVADPTLPPTFSEAWASHPCSSHHWTQRHAFPASMSHNCL